MIRRIPEKPFFYFQSLNCRTQADSKYEKYMLALMKDVAKFKGKANVTIEK